MVATEIETAAAPPPPAKLSALQGLGMLAGVIAVIAGFIALCGALGNSEFYGGFLFLLCWSALEHSKMEKLPHVALGAAFGIALGVALHQLTAGPLGATGGLVFLGIILPVIYCQIMGWFPLLVNFTAMTFLTVATIPHIQAHGDFQDLVIALALGVAYFGAILAGVGWLTSRAQRKR